MVPPLVSAALLPLTLACVGIVFFKYVILVFTKPRLPLPPGPRRLPIIGNLLDMPKQKEHLKFTEWGKKYGDIVYLNVLGTHIIILNSAKLAVEVMDKKSNIYSDRPHLEYGGEMVGYNRVLLSHFPYGNRLRKYRRLIHHLIGSRSQIKRFHPLVEKANREFLRRILKDPNHAQHHIRNLVGRIILKMAYGYDTQEHDDPFIKLAEQVSRQFALSFAPGAFLVDVFPLLRYVPSWFPGAQFKGTAVQWRRNMDDAANIPFGLTDGSNVPNFTSDLLEKNHSQSDIEVDIKWSAASLTLGGADTSVSAVYSFFLAMTLYPDVQRKAQEEIDKVIGTDRLPTSADRDALPYIDALVTEVLRWNPVSPIGGPHRLRQDDEHAGYYIPKGATVIPNVWGFLHDPEVYENPSEFEPSRFIPKEGKLAAPDAREYCFGFGRRICPGVHLADSSIWISCALSLAVFHISKTVEDGKVVEPVVEYTGGLVSHPAPFKCTIKPRSAKAEALISSEELNDN
ncbi:hypothetical protein NM688_g5386 [Phlebia brevispora]|uniref:Uncharacterized protein n=1 Tax=Phlebia brevispora TaxID=194682 RepID=A0ACC1SWP7_9APHY|nr:hypothetical protein NM688_g5386 [Phlebia brevispora]